MHLAHSGIRATRGLIAALLLLMAALGARPPASLAQDDAGRFANLLATRDAAASLVGPLSGELVLQEGVSTIAGAGLTVQDFSATATFFNPRDESPDAWDIGITFHQTPDAIQQVVVDSSGLWSYTPYPGGTVDSGLAPTFDPERGAMNTLDLIVTGATAYVGLNGEFLASIQLPPAVPSDVQVGSGFFASTTAPGRAIGYIDFEVWPAPADGASAPDPAGTQAPAGAAETPPAVSAEDAEAFAMILASQSQAIPLAGPYNANLTEEEDRIALSWADVDVADFHARATFDVPESTSAVPWNIGFMFRTGPQGTIRVSLDSESTWYASAGTASPVASGRVTGLVTEAGGANTLDLLVANQRAVLGVNGNFAAAIDLAPETSAADVAVGAAFYNDQTVADRVIPFRDFVVLPFDPDAVTIADDVTADARLDAEAFAEYAAETEQVAPLIGPLAGRLVEQSAGVVPLAPAGVALADFGAIASFITPDEVIDGLWDAGFQFRSDETVTHRLAMGFNGEVYAVLPGASPQIVGTATTFDAAPGAVNTLQLFVTGSRGLIGVNGEFVAAIEITSAPIAADVLVGAAFFDEDLAPNRVTAYEGFRIWEIV